MKKIIRFLAGIMAVAMLIGNNAFAENTEEADKAESSLKTITVGTVSALDGNLYGNIFGNNTTDMDLRLLLHDYATVALTNEHSYALNKTAVKNMECSSDSDGKTYTFTIQDNLCYNDGTPITAKDYVFTILLQSSPQLASIGGSVVNYAEYCGWQAYSNGEIPEFKGVHLVGDTAFSVTVSTESEEYFYDLMNVEIYPTPFSVIAPECEIKDDGNGAYISGKFTSELLQETLMDADHGYLNYPSVTSGAYQIESLNIEEHSAVFVKNDKYVGNYEGRIPEVDRINVVHVTDSIMQSAFDNKEVDVILKVVTKENIDMIQNRKDGYPVRYLRSGYGFIAFDCEDTVTSSKNVRKAIAYITDKDKLIDRVFGEYGYPVYASYGAGQWMSLYDEGLYLDRIEKDAPNYAPDYNKASDLLMIDGWTLNEEGKVYSPKDGIRYREENGQLIPLEFRLAWGDDNAVAPELLKILKPACDELGIKLIAEEIPFEKMLREYYRQEEREHNAYLLATNFDYVFDPYPMVSNDEYRTVWNTTGIDDSLLQLDAKELNQTSPGDTNEYLNEWVRFQLRWAEVLPTLPLYTNVYYDLVRSNIRGFYSDSFTSWALSMPYVTVS